MQTTPNLGLKKYETNDTADLTAIGPNWDTLDQEVVKRIVNAGGVPSIQAGPDASKPAPGTAGRLYVATNTQIIYRDTGSAWQKVGVVKWNDIQGKPDLALAADLAAHVADGASHSKTARFVVGTSTAGWTAADCDYLCDGTNDQEEIRQAVQAIPASGGEIVILDGTYNLTASILVNKSNVSIKGNGNATVLKRMWDSSSAQGVIHLNNVSNCKIENLQVDGNALVYTSSNNYGIYLYSSNNNTITGNTCYNNRYGIYLYSNSNNNTITGNTCNSNSNNGIQLYSNSNNNTITGNTCNNNGSYGIHLYSSSNNTITGNTCNSNNSRSISLSLSSNNTITGNTCNNNDSGIYLTTNSNNNTITGNTCVRGTGQPSDYTSSQYTIHLSGSSNSYNLISSNNCMGKDVVIGGGTNNTSVNNKYN